MKLSVRIGLLLVLWIGLVAASAWLQHVVYVRPSSAADSSTAEPAPAIKVAHRFFTTANFPGRFAVGTLFGVTFGRSEIGTALAAAINWGFALLALAFVLPAPRASTHAGVSPSGGAPAHQEAPSIAIQPVPAQRVSRRAFFLRSTGVAAGALGTGALAWGTAIEPDGLVVRRYTVAIRDLPQSLDGFRIVQLSDTHLGPYMTQAQIARAVRTALELDPDLVALTGDYVLTSPAYIAPAAELFRPLLEERSARCLGVVGVLGNHDHWEGTQEMIAALGAVGVRLIDNDRVFIDADRRAIADDQPAGAALCIAGLGDLLTDAVLPERALAGVRPEVPRVVLAHNPDTCELAELAGRTPMPTTGWRAGNPRLSASAADDRAAAPATPPPVEADRAESEGRPARIDLMLSGHTHGGQVHVPLLGRPIVPSAYGQRYEGGLKQGPAFPIVISRGVGLSMLPVRLMVPPEVVQVTLARL